MCVCISYSYVCTLRISLRISHNFLPLFLIYSHTITYYSYAIPQTLLHQSSNVHTLHDSCAITIIFFLILFEKQHFAFIIFIISLLFDILCYIKPFLFSIILLYIVLASILAIIPDKICYLAKLCWHNRLKRN